MLIFGANITSDPDIGLQIENGEIRYGADFSQVTVRQGGLLSLGPQRGITLGNLINIDHGLPMSDTISIMGEELWHVTQYQTQGFWGFLVQYGSQWAGACFKYSGIGLEQEAWKMRDLVFCPQVCVGP